MTGPDRPFEPTLDAREYRTALRFDNERFPAKPPVVALIITEGGSLP